MNIGDKVVCVDDSPCVQCGGNGNIKKGIVYVIQNIRQSTLGKVTILDLIGVNPNCHNSPYGKTAYSANRFRLLSEMQSEAAQRKTAHA
jgi:hypothetical protein